MKRNQFFLAIVAVLGSAAAAGCGDNSRECGTGTTDDGNGRCVGDNITCTGGTVLDPTTNSCVIDPTACQDGTVLVDGACVDPGHVTADIEEAAEPNGLGILGEESAAQAGDILVKPVGQSFVIHGTIIPFQDANGDGQTDADVDTYLIELTGPALITASVDGLHGLSGAFASLAVVNVNDPLFAWQRLAVNVTGDTSKRQLFLPAAGTYAFVVVDTRTLLTAESAGAASGDLDFEYYVSINQETAAPTALAVTAGEASATGTLAPGEVKLFTVPMGTGFNQAVLDIPAVQTTGSIVIAQATGGVTRARIVGDEDQDFELPADSGLVLGFRDGDTTTIVADHVISTANSPVDFELTVTVGRNSGALSRTGATAVQPEIPGVVSGAPITDFVLFFYDVTAANEIDGFNLVFDQPVTGTLIDENLFILSFFTFDPFDAFTFEDTFSTYVGHLRHPAPGRYYFAVYEPSETGATDITATSTITAVTPTTVTQGTVTGAQTVDPTFLSNTFAYNAGGVDPWQQFTTVGTGTGNTTTDFYNPTNAFGRLDPLTSTCGAFCEDRFPTFTTTQVAAGAPLGRILIDDGNQNYLTVVRAANNAGTYTLDFTVRANVTNLGIFNPPTTANQTAVALSGTTTIQRYIVRTTRDDEVGISVDPTAITLNTTIQQVNNNESARGAAINNGVLGDPDTTQVYQRAEGWMAWTVQSAVPLVTNESFDQAVTGIQAAYTVATTATAFDDACVGGTAVALEDADEGRSTADVPTPAGFDYFKVAAPNVRVFANGFVSVNTALVCPSVGGSCFFTNADLPVAGNPNGMMAAFWDDLITTVCQKTVGTKLVIQWTGTVFGAGTPVAFQVILDGADDTIEYVYSASHQPRGAAATIGVENAAGTKSKFISFNTDISALPGAGRKLTPTP